MCISSHGTSIWHGKFNSGWSMICSQTSKSSIRHSVLLWSNSRNYSKKMHCTWPVTWGANWFQFRSHICTCVYMAMAFIILSYMGREFQCILSIWKRGISYPRPYIIKLPKLYPDSKVHWANMGPIWDQEDPGWPHVGRMNFAIWVHAVWLGKLPAYAASSMQQ